VLDIGDQIEKLLNDIVGQIWTMLGMFVAWILVDGVAKNIVGYSILITFGVWVLSYPLRRPKD
jgi:hypothetical protein